jgi:hypothetical protein
MSANANRGLIARYHHPRREIASMCGSGSTRAPRPRLEVIRKLANRVRDVGAIFTKRTLRATGLKQNSSQLTTPAAAPTGSERRIPMAVRQTALSSAHFGLALADIPFRVSHVRGVERPHDMETVSWKRFDSSMLAIRRRQFEASANTCIRWPFSDGWFCRFCEEVGLNLQECA